MWTDQARLTGPPSLALLGEEGDGLDLEPRIGDEAGDLDGRAAGRVADERLAAGDVVVGIVLGAGHIAGDLDHVAHARAGFLKRLANARKALVGLGREGGVDHLAVVVGADLTGDVDPAAGAAEADRVAERGSPRTGYALLFHVSSPYFGWIVERRATSASAAFRPSWASSSASPAVALDSAISPPGPMNTPCVSAAR